MVFISTLHVPHCQFLIHGGSVVIFVRAISSHALALKELGLLKVERGFVLVHHRNIALHSTICTSHWKISAALWSLMRIGKLFKRDSRVGPQISSIKHVSHSLVLRLGQDVFSCNLAFDDALNQLLLLLISVLQLMELTLDFQVSIALLTLAAFLTDHRGLRRVIRVTGLMIEISHSTSSPERHCARRILALPSENRSIAVDAGSLWMTTTGCSKISEAWVRRLSQELVRIDLRYGVTAEDTRVTSNATSSQTRLHSIIVWLHRAKSLVREQLISRLWIIRQNGVVPRLQKRGFIIEERFGSFLPLVDIRTLVVA